MKTVTQIRESFWDMHPMFKPEYRKTWRQNKYRTDIRCAFVDWIDHLKRNGDISEKLGRRATL